LKIQSGTTSCGKNTLHFAGISELGLTRKANEDDFLILPKSCLFLVADGMGGHEAGAAASRLVTESAEKFMTYRNHQEMTVISDGLTQEMLKEPPLKGIVHYANSRICQKASGKVMGSTVVALYFNNNDVTVANVGDSRAYLWRNNLLEQITEDHSLVYELFRAGEISREEMHTHPRRNVITRAIGAHAYVEPNLLQIQPVAGDLLLLCSDGLTSMVRDDEIDRSIRLEKNISDLAKTLVRQANEAGGKDNITVVVVSVQ
jgi:serine/threonine protein phosphatase PrpC